HDENEIDDCGDSATPSLASSGPSGPHRPGDPKGIAALRGISMSHSSHMAQGQEQG
ncbi:hypothetical protein LTR16_007871, partial [Cryomyces antarcticus]